MKKLLPLLLLPLAVNAFEPTPGYELVAKTVEGEEIFLHMASIRKQGNYASFWTEETISAKTRKGTSAWSRTKSVINCETDEIAVADVTRYGKKGEVLEGKTFTKRHWYSIPPGTVTYILKTHVCAKK